MHYPVIMTVALAMAFFPQVSIAQQTAGTAPEITFCDPLLSADKNELEDDDGDDEELEQTWRYDLEQAERLSSREQIMNALFEEKWNFETGQSIPRNELCGAEENYVILWSRMLRPGTDGQVVLDADGYMSIRKDGTFQFTFAKRPYVGTWELDGLDMVLTADWINGGAPYRTPVEFVRIPVETVDENGAENSYLDEMYRLGVFRFYRLPTTVKGRQQTCSCANQGS